MQLVPSSLTRNGIQAPCSGRAESQPLDHKGIPETPHFNKNVQVICVHIQI